jgi:DNA-binding phage protein
MNAAITLFQDSAPRERVFTSVGYTATVTPAPRGAWIPAGAHHDPEITRTTATMWEVRISKGSMALDAQYRVCDNERAAVTYARAALRANRSMLTRALLEALRRTLSAAQIASSIGVDLSTVYRWARNDGVVPTDRRIDKLQRMKDETSGHVGRPAWQTA